MVQYRGFINVILLSSHSGESQNSGTGGQLCYTRAFVIFWVRFTYPRLREDQLPEKWRQGALAARVSKRAQVVHRLDQRVEGR